MRLGGLLQPVRAKSEQLALSVKRFPVSLPCLSFPATRQPLSPLHSSLRPTLLFSLLFLLLLLPAPPTHLHPHVPSIAVASGAFLPPTRPWTLPLLGFVTETHHRRQGITEGLRGEVAGPRPCSGECPLGKPKRIGTATEGLTDSEVSFYKRKLCRAA